MTNTVNPQISTWGASSKLERRQGGAYLSKALHLGGGGPLLNFSHILVRYSLHSWQDFAHECFCFGREAVNMSGEAVRGLVKSRVEFPPAQIR